VLLPSQAIELAERLAQLLRQRVEQGPIRTRPCRPASSGVNVFRALRSVIEGTTPARLLERAPTARCTVHGPAQSALLCRLARSG